MGFTVRHAIDTDADTMWRLFFDQELARAMLRKLGDIGGFEVVEERTDDDGLLHRRIEVWSNVELPAIAQKLVGNGAYTELGCFDPKHKKYTARCVPKLNPDRFGTQFEVTVHPLAPGRCERQIVVENTVKVFGIGGMVESLLERVQRDSHDQSARFLNEWLRANPQRPS